MREKIGPIDPEEIKVVTFPFEEELTGDTIATAQVTSSLVDDGTTTDAGADQMAYGAAVISGTDVKQRVSGVGRVDGATYLLKAKVESSAGLIHIVKRKLQVKS